MAHTSWRWSSHRLLNGGWSQMAVSTHFGSRGTGNIWPLTSDCCRLLLLLLLWLLRLFLAWLRADSATALVLFLSEAPLESLEHIITSLLLCACVYVCMCVCVCVCVCVCWEIHVCTCKLILELCLSIYRHSSVTKNSASPSYRYTVFLHEVLWSVMILPCLTGPVAGLHAWQYTSKLKPHLCLAITRQHCSKTCSPDTCQTHCTAHSDTCRERKSMITRRAQSKLWQLAFFTTVSP